MPRLSTLVDDFAERFSFEKTKLGSLARYMREAGLLTTGARGVNAPSATPLDAARLIIAMMLDSKLPNVVEDVRLVGSFVIVDREQWTPAFKPETLEQGLADLFAYVGMASEEAMSDFALSFTLTPYAAIGTIEIARIPESGEEKRATLIFAHPDVANSEPNKPLPATYLDIARRFPLGFYQQPMLRTGGITGVGQLVMGEDLP